MLPGLRLLFASTLIAISLLVFGMGAIALLRASHQQFASQPPGAPPEPVFAQGPETVPSLSILRPEAAPTPPPQTAGSEQFASLTSAERGGAPTPTSVFPTTPSAVAGEPQAGGEPAKESRSDTAPEKAPPPSLPMPEVTPLAEKPVEPEAAPSVSVAEVPVAASEEAASAQVAAAPPPQNSEPEVTGSVAPREVAPAETPVPDPPLPQARPEMAALTPVASPAPPKATVKPAAHKARHSIRRNRARVERLKPATSAPTFGTLFGSPNN